ncbi:ABC transporter permease [Aggregatilinea lenta]|uniref:ABC transporter permease n=1 Tax=Aggregatilinea lenta TaxID=913108 RepID=UPI0013C2E1F4|nr:ABC transporter permease [Aggregatilinea lenta]
MEAQIATPAAAPGDKPLPFILRFFQIFESLGVLVMLLVLFGVMAAIKPVYLNTNNLNNIVITGSIIAVTGLGMTIAVAMGDLDLSVGSNQALTACIAADLLTRTSMPLTIGATLLIGLLVGVVNGVIISRLKVPAFVATLGMMSVLRGAALLYTDGQSILIMGYDDFAALNTSKVLGLPMPFIIALVTLLFFYVLLRHTPFGRHVCAIGGNENAARATGLRIGLTRVIVFGLVGMAAALSGIMLSAQLLFVDGTLGKGLELQAIAVTVLGGTSLAGGSGNLPGTLLGALLIAAINSALNILKVPPFYQYLALGLLLILALSLDTARRAIIKRVVTGGVR